MDPICLNCSNNSFKIFNAEDGKPVAKCVKCGALTPFEHLATDAGKGKTTKQKDDPQNTSVAK
jgi:uncharacterized Zn finger protein